LKSVNLGNVQAGSQTNFALELNFSSNTLMIKRATFSNPIALWVSVHVFPQILHLGYGQINFTLSVPATASSGLHTESVQVQCMDPFGGESSISAPFVFTVVNGVEESAFNPLIIVVLAVVFGIIAVAFLAVRR
jgi:hypothetical protein